MDKLRIIHYQSGFDKIVHFINSEDNSEQVEVWFARNFKFYWAMPVGRISL